MPAVSIVMVCMNRPDNLGPCLDSIKQHTTSEYEVYVYQFNNVLYWISLLMHNRELSSRLINNYPRELKYLEDNYLLNVSDYDVVIGYRADDSYFHFPEAFVRSEITLESLNSIFAAGDLGKQYVLISERAFKLIRFVDYQEVYEKSQKNYYKRKNDADKIFTDLLEADRYKKGIRLRDLVMDNE